MVSGETSGITYTGDNTIPFAILGLVMVVIIIGLVSGS